MTARRLSLALAAVLVVAAAPQAVQAQSAELSEAEVTRHLAGRTFQMRRGPATFARDGGYTFAIRAGGGEAARTITSRWRACGSAVCLESGWRGALEVAGGAVVLTDPQGNRINLGAKR